MELHVITADDEQPQGVDVALAVPVGDDDTPESKLMRESDAAAFAILEDSGAFKAKGGGAYFLPTPDGPYCGIAALGIGSSADNGEPMRRSAGSACAALATHRVTHVVIDATSELAWPVTASVEGIVLGQYRFDRYKTKTDDTPPPVKHITVVAASADQAAILKRACREAVVRCRAANWARDLANTAPADMTPKHISSAAKSIADGEKIVFHQLDEGKMRDLGMNALLAVTRGASTSAHLVILEYRSRADAPTIALVGKGITFDTGGISIKPSENMHEMKYDMCGAAAVLGTMYAIKRLRPAINVICVVPTAENVVGPDAVKPGEIVTAYNGKTIEILNTDAEGRLILADALAYVTQEYKPDFVVDLATLTGAAIVAFGHIAAGVMGTDEGLVDALQDAGEVTGERIWPLPLWDDYSELMKGTHADLANIGPARQAGTIMGGAFLKEFVGDTPWAHIDIASTAWGVTNTPYWNKDHATGFGVRLLTQWLTDEAGSRVS